MRHETLYMIYDGDCPICKIAASVIRIRESVGRLEIINARDGNSIANEIRAMGYDLNEGVVLLYNSKVYHGAEAAHMIAVLGSSIGAISQLGMLLLRSKFISKLFYPILKGLRNLLLKLLRIQPIASDNSVPVLKLAIPGYSWERLKPAIVLHYANRPHSNDLVKLEGIMQISASRFHKFIAKIAGMPLSCDGAPAQVTVELKSLPTTDYILLKRTFKPSQKNKMVFNSKLLRAGDNIMLEVFKFGISWAASYSSDDLGRLIIHHKAYVLYLFGIRLPLPISWLIGCGKAVVESKGERGISMCTTINHWYFGVMLEYKGDFDIL